MVVRLDRRRDAKELTPAPRRCDPRARYSDRAPELSEDRGELTAERQQDRARETGEERSLDPFRGCARQDARDEDRRASPSDQREGRQGRQRWTRLRSGDRQDRRRRLGARRIGRAPRREDESALEVAEAAAPRAAEESAEGREEARSDEDAVGKHTKTTTEERPDGQAEWRWNEVSVEQERR